MSTPRRYAPAGRYHRSEQLATLRWNEWLLCVEYALMNEVAGDAIEVGLRVPDQIPALDPQYAQIRFQSITMIGKKLCDSASRLRFRHALRGSAVLPRTAFQSL